MPFKKDNTLYMTKHFIFISFILFSFLHCQVADAQTAGHIINKIIPEEVRSPVVKALAKYPELQDIQIDFIFKDKIKNCIMQAQPRVSSFLKNKLKRSYKIKIKRNILTNDGLQPIETLPEHILVGWFAHELGHIVDYLQRSSINMTGFGLRYITSKRFLRKAEQVADQYAVAHGFAEEIILTKKYILEKSAFPEDYKLKIDGFYPSPKDIEVLQADGEVKK